MDSGELQKNIALYYSKLPPKLQEVFSSMQWLETLKQISEKYGLSQEQTRALGTETTLVLLGIIKPDKYEEALEKELQLPGDSLKQISTEINDSVLNTIRPELVKTFEANIKPQTPEEQQREDELDARFEKLPLEIKNTILESNYHAILYKIATEHNLTVSQIVALEKTTTDVMLGIIKGNEFEESVKKNVGLSDEKNKEVVTAVSEKILMKIREKMKNLYSYSEKTEEEENNTKILNEHGIEILNGNKLPVPEKLELDSPLEEYSPTKVGEGGGEFVHPDASATPQEGNNTTHPILAEKLSGYVSNTVVKTEHSMENITKTSDTTTPPQSNSKKYGVDPYREKPE